MVAGDDREVVAYLEALEEFVNVRPKEERVAETERRGEAHRGVGWHIRLGCRAGTVFAEVSDVKLVQVCRRQRREEVGVEGVNLARAFSAVGRSGVSRHVIGLVL